jgi:hypothetical protein
MSDQPKKRVKPYMILPLVPAARWMLLRSAFVRATGLKMFEACEGEPIEGLSLRAEVSAAGRKSYPEIEDWTLAKMFPLEKERKTIRAHVRLIVEAKLVVEIPGGLMLLYSEKQYRDHQRTGPAQSADGSPTPTQPSSDGSPTPPQPSANGFPTVDGKSAESLNTGSLKRERKRNKKRERQRARGDAPSSVSDTGMHLKRWADISLDAQLDFSAAVDAKFQELHLQRVGTKPTVNCPSAEDFPERVWDTAHQRIAEPLPLLEQAIVTWCERGCEGSTETSPYAAFIARFDRCLPRLRVVRGAREPYAKVPTPDAFTRQTGDLGQLMGGAGE